MTLEIFLLILLIISALTGLVTEALKKCFEESKKKYSSNLIAGIAAVSLSVGVGAAYIILTGAILNEKMAVYLIALIFLSWLSAMVGYDKVVQVISQLKNGKVGE